MPCVGISDCKDLMMLIAFIAYFIISLPAGYFFGFVIGLGITRGLDGFSFRTE